MAMIGDSGSSAAARWASAKPLARYPAESRSSDVPVVGVGIPRGAQQRLVEIMFRIGKAAVRLVVQGPYCVGFPKPRIELQRAVRRLQRRIPLPLHGARGLPIGGAAAAIPGHQGRQQQGTQRMGPRKPGVPLQGGIDVRERAVNVLGGLAPQHPFTCLEKQLPRFHVAGRPPAERRGFIRTHGNLQGMRDLPGHVALDREDVSELALVALRPQVRVAGGVDELRRDLHPAPCSLHAAFHDIAHTQPTSDGLQIELLAPERE